MSGSYRVTAISVGSTSGKKYGRCETDPEKSFAKRYEPLSVLTMFPRLQPRARLWRRERTTTLLVSTSIASPSALCFRSISVASFASSSSEALASLVASAMLRVIYPIREPSLMNSLPDLIVRLRGG